MKFMIFSQEFAGIWVHIYIVLSWVYFVSCLVVNFQVEGQKIFVPKLVSGLVWQMSIRWGDDVSSGMSVPISFKPTLQNAWESFPGFPGTSTTEVDENSGLCLHTVFGNLS